MLKNTGHGYQTIANSAWNMSSFLFGVVLNLITIPFAVSHLGIVQFGLAGLVAACVAPATILSVTLSLTLTRELVQNIEPTCIQQARDVFGTAFFIAISAAICCVGMLNSLGPWMAIHFFNLEQLSLSTIEHSFWFASLGWVCAILGGIWQALFIARQKYPRLAQINIVSSIVMATLVFTMVPKWPTAPVYLGCLSGGFIVNMIMWIATSLYTLPNWLSLPRLNRKALIALARVGGWQAAAQTGGSLSGQIDRYLIGAFLQPEYVGYYNIAQRLEEAIYIGILKIGEVLFPLFGTLLKESAERQADIFFRSAWLLNLLGVSLFGAVIPSAKDILRLWTNAEIAVQAQGVLITLAIAGMIGSAANVFGFYLLGSGRTFYTALLSVISACAISVSSLVVLPLFGWSAAGWSAVVGMMAQTIIIIILFPRCFSIEDVYMRLLHFVLLPIGVGLAAAWTLLEVFEDIMHAEKNASLWQVIFIYGISVLLIVVAVVMTSRLGPYFSVCWADLKKIANRFTQHPLR
jgi:O-antigen/teichoic acid export membrane protein